MIGRKLRFQGKEGIWLIVRRRAIDKVINEEYINKIMLIVKLEHLNEKKHT